MSSMFTSHDQITVRLTFAFGTPVSLLEEAGMDGSRTHRGPQRDPPPVLKTGRPTGT